MGYIFLNIVTKPFSHYSMILFAFEILHFKIILSRVYSLWEKNLHHRVCLNTAYFAKTEKLLLKVL